MNYFAAEAMWLWSSAAADVLISIALSISLHKRIRGFNPTLDGVLRHLIIVGLRTAAYTAVTSIVGAAVSTAFAVSDNYLTATAGFAFWVVLPALHAISLFTTLSTRRTFANALGANGGVVSKVARDPESPIDLRPASAFLNNMPIRADDDDENGQKSMSQTSSNGGGLGVGGRGRRNVPLVVRVDQEREVTYDIRSSSDEDFLAHETRGRRTIGGTRRDSFD